VCARRRNIYTRLSDVLLPTIITRVLHCAAAAAKRRKDRSAPLRRIQTCGIVATFSETAQCSFGIISRHVCASARRFISLALPRFCRRCCRYGSFHPRI